MRLLDSIKEEQRQPGSVPPLEAPEETARRLRRKMRVHPRPSVARAASASSVAETETNKPAA